MSAQASATGMRMMGRGMGAATTGMVPQGAASTGPINAPRGPRGAPIGPQAGVGPQQMQRGHGYHPYSR